MSKSRHMSCQGKWTCTGVGRKVKHGDKWASPAKEAERTDTRLAWEINLSEGRIYSKETAINIAMEILKRCVRHASNIFARLVDLMRENTRVIMK